MSVIEKRARGSSLHEWPGGDELVENSPTATLTAAQWLSHGLHFRRGCGKVFFGRGSVEVVTCILDLPFDRSREGSRLFRLFSVASRTKGAWGGQLAPH